MRLRAAGFATLMGLVMIAAASWPCASARAGLLDLDFGSLPGGDAGIFGSLTTPLGAAPGYTAFNVPHLGFLNQTAANPSATANGVTFTINGNISAWGGRNSNVPTPPDALLGDYLFIPKAPTFGVAPLPMPWTVSGLIPNASYEFVFSHGENDANGGVPNGLGGRQVTINSGAQSLTVSSLLGDRTKSLVLLSDGGGTITGTFTGGGEEGNLAALSIRVPEPASIALVGLGSLGSLLMIRRKPLGVRRTRESQGRRN